MSCVIDEILNLMIFSKVAYNFKIRRNKIDVQSVHCQLLDINRILKNKIELKFENWKFEKSLQSRYFGIRIFGDLSRQLKKRDVFKN